MNRTFCTQKPGEIFNGVTMPDNKTVLDGTANAASVLVLMTYLSERRCKSGKGAGKDVLDKKSLEVAMEALADLKVQQMALEPDRFPSAEDRRSLCIFCCDFFFKFALNVFTFVAANRFILVQLRCSSHVERASTPGCVPRTQITTARALISRNMDIH